MQVYLIGIIFFLRSIYSKFNAGITPYDARGYLIWFIQRSVYDARGIWFGLYWVFDLDSIGYYSKFSVWCSWVFDLDSIGYIQSSVHDARGYLIWTWLVLFSFFGHLYSKFTQGSWRGGRLMLRCVIYVWYAYVWYMCDMWYMWCILARCSTRSARRGSRVPGTWTQRTNTTHEHK